MNHIGKIKNNKYIITGGCGFIGSTLVDYLINDCNVSQVIVIDDLSSGYEKNLPQSKKIQFINSKVQEIDDSFSLKGISGIFHLAAQTSVPYSMKNFFKSSSNNLLSSLKIIDLANKSNLPVVYASSSAIYGNLKLGNDKVSTYEILSPYAQDKLTLEDYFKMAFDIYGLSSIGLRFFNVYGPKQDPSNPYSGVISIFIDSLLSKKPVTVNGGFQTRDFIFVDDIIKILVESMLILKKRQCSFFNVGTGTSISIDRLLKILIKLTSTNPKIIRKDLPKGDPQESSGSYEKLEKILNVKIKTFHDLESGLEKTLKYYMDN